MSDLSERLRARGAINDWTNLMEQAADEIDRLEQLVLDQLDTLVSLWHEDKNLVSPLHELLGMTEDQYKAWACNPRAIFGREQ